jgi:hypothetical protein
VLTTQPPEGTFHSRKQDRENHSFVRLMQGSSPTAIPQEGSNKWLSTGLFRRWLEGDEKEKLD